MLKVKNMNKKILKMKSPRSHLNDGPHGQRIAFF